MNFYIERLWFDMSGRKEGKPCGSSSLIHFIMKVYFLRRLLLVPLTVLGVTFLVFAITRGDAWESAGA
jgi:hypothetical protein